jgi:hypothetical protein
MICVHPQFCIHSTNIKLTSVGTLRIIQGERLHVQYIHIHIFMILKYFKLDLSEFIATITNFPFKPLHTADISRKSH